jgi:C-terminal processing protease CtpA/Prc
MTRRFSVLALMALLVGIGAVVIAADISEKDVKKGKSAFLGVVLDEVSDKVAADYGVGAGGGALVQEISRHSPADEAGLRANDIIVKFGTTSIGTPDDLRGAIREKSPGDIVTLEIVRGGKRQSVEVTLGSQTTREIKKIIIEDDDDFEEAYPGKAHKFMERAKRGYAGVHLQELGEGLAKYFKVDKGVLISDVEKDSPAQKAGLEAGDVIVRIDGDATEDAGDVRRLVRRHEPGETAKFEIVRKGKTQTVEVKLGERSLDWHGLGSLGPGFRHWFGGPSPQRRIRVEGDILDEDLEELLEDIEGIKVDIDTDRIRAKAYELRTDLQPQIDELKEQLQSLRKELERLRERMQEKM